jgi:hypothetical protein
MPRCIPQRSRAAAAQVGDPEAIGAKQSAEVIAIGVAQTLGEASERRLLERRDRVVARHASEYDRSSTVAQSLARAPVPVVPRSYARAEVRPRAATYRAVFDGIDSMRRLKCGCAMYGAYGG